MFFSLLLLFDVERLTALVGVLGDLGDFGVLEEVDCEGVVDGEGVVEMGGGGGVAAAFLFERVVTISLIFVLLRNAFAAWLGFFRVEFKFWSVLEKSSRN